MKTVPTGLKKLSDAVDKKVVKNTKFNKVDKKVNNFDKKIPEATTLIHINQYNKEKQSLEKTIEDVDKKIRGVSGLVTSTVLNTKNSEAENKIPVASGSVTKAVLNTKSKEVDNKKSDVSDLVKKTNYYAKILDIGTKYFTTSVCNRFTKKNT